MIIMQPSGKYTEALIGDDTVLSPVNPDDIGAVTIDTASLDDAAIAEIKRQYMSIIAGPLEVKAMQ